MSGGRSGRRFLKSEECSDLPQFRICTLDMHNTSCFRFPLQLAFHYDSTKRSTIMNVLTNTSNRRLHSSSSESSARQLLESDTVGIQRNARGYVVPLDPNITKGLHPQSVKRLEIFSVKIHSVSHNNAHTL